MKKCFIKINSDKCAKAIVLLIMFLMERTIANLDTGKNYC